jgi:aspartyl-tRNA synthetase
MVKFAQNVSTESTLAVTGTVSRVKEAVKSATIKDFEIHVSKLFVEAKAEVPLPLQVEDAERPLPSEGAGEEAQESDGRPLVGLNTRLNNRTIDLRAKINHAVFVIKSGVCALFQEFLSQKGFVLVQTPKILGAASEGGSSVFEVNYFGKPACKCIITPFPSLIEIYIQYQLLKF